MMGAWLLLAGFPVAAKPPHLTPEKQRLLSNLQAEIRLSYDESVERALFKCSEAITAFPRVSSLYIERASAYVALSRFEKARADLKHAAVLDSSLARDSAILSAASYQLQNKLELALATLNKGPKDSFGQDNLEVLEAKLPLLIELKQMELAREAYSALVLRLEILGFKQRLLSLQERYPQFHEMVSVQERLPTDDVNTVLKILSAISRFASSPTFAQVESASGFELRPNTEWRSDTFSNTAQSKAIILTYNPKKHSVQFDINRVQCALPKEVFLNAIEGTNEDAQSSSNFIYETLNRRWTFEFNEDNTLKSGAFVWQQQSSVKQKQVSEKLVPEHPKLLSVLKQIDELGGNFSKTKIQAITGQKLYLDTSTTPSYYTSRPKSLALVYSPFHVHYFPDGFYFLDKTIDLTWGDERLTQSDIESILGKGVELTSENSDFLIDSSALNLSFKRSYGSITCLFQKDTGFARAAYFWLKRKSQFDTLETYESSKSAALIYKDAMAALERKEYKKSRALLINACQREGFCQHCGESKLLQWEKIRAALVRVYEKTNKPGQASYLRVAPCAFVMDDINELESSRHDFKTLSEWKKLRWTVDRYPLNICYSINGESSRLEIFPSSPNFNDAVRLFGQSDIGGELVLKSLPAELYDSVWFGADFYK